MAKVFFSYSHKDRKIRDDIDKHFAVLKHSKTISSWYDNEILAGEDFDHEIKQELESADIILLLISADFLNSRYCQDVEVKRALEKQTAGLAKVVPIIIDACDWKHSVIRHLKSLPDDGREIAKYRNKRVAYQNITDSVRQLAEVVNNPIHQFTDRVTTYQSFTATSAFSNAIKAMRFIGRNFKLISAVAILIFIASHYQSNYSEVDTQIISAEPSSRHFLEMDLNRDGYLDRVNFLAYMHPKNQQGLYVYLSDANTTDYNSVVFKSGEIWSDGRPSDDTRLYAGEDNSLIVEFTELMLSELQYRIKIAYLNNNLVITEYNRYSYDKLLCSINYLSGLHVDNGSQALFPQELTTLQDWSLNKVPTNCR